MKKLTLIVAALAALAAPAVAKTHRHRAHRPHCAPAHVAKRVRVRSHHHSRMVWRCVRSRPSTAVTAVHYSTAVDPTFTQALDNPLAVAYQYSASATATVNGQTTNLAATGQLPDGVLNFYSPSAPGQGATLVCSMNVGGSVIGGACPVTYQDTGTYDVTTQYIPNSASAVTETDAATISPYSTTTSEQIGRETPAPNGWPYAITVVPQVTGQNGNALSPSGQQVQITVSDAQNGTSATFIGAGTLTLAVQRDDGATGEAGAVGNNYSEQGSLIVASTDTLSITSQYVGTAGYTGSASPTAQTSGH